MVLPVWKKACCSFFWFFDSLYNGMSKGILLVGEAASSSSPSSLKHLWLSRSRCRCQLGLIAELHWAIPPLPLTAWLLTVIPLPLSRYLLNMGRRRSRLKFTSMESLEIVHPIVNKLGPASCFYKMISIS